MPDNGKIYMRTVLDEVDMAELPAVVEVDGRGRVQIPLPVRRALGIKQGDFVSLKVSKISEEVIAKSESGNPLEAVTLALA
jgi:bifunctional DNA-binding transcriptional regulator/antitoxin component of YhaV-PrlF toxin-antitoxin module